MTKKKQDSLVNKLSFEDALDQLEEIVKQLEKGELSLEQSLEQYGLGVKLSQLCLIQLNAAEGKITKVLSEKNGEIVELPLAFQEDE
ncbi:Exodeoxyribonuclease 7 small subunit [bioreactor metagenome]|uniref:Exodeoxyribonuclease 7 small subunit n=1 Tax=bioreactor metagenome TaxID=1076179 RepID=A0A644V0B6_9ZZZZ